MCDYQVVKFSILVTGNPASSQSASSAYQFCSAALAAGHAICGVFFYLDGVLTASNLIVLPVMKLICLNYGRN